MISFNRRYKDKEGRIIECDIINDEISGNNANYHLYKPNLDECIFIKPIAKMITRVFDDMYTISIVEDKRITWGIIFYYDSQDDCIQENNIEYGIIEIDTYDYGEEDYPEVILELPANEESEYNIYPDDIMYGNLYYIERIYKFLFWKLNRSSFTELSDKCYKILYDWEPHKHYPTMNNVLYSRTLTFSGDLRYHFVLHESFGDSISIDLELQNILNNIFRDTLYDPVVVEYERDMDLSDYNPYVILKDSYGVYIINYTMHDEFRVYDLERNGYYG